MIKFATWAALAALPLGPMRPLPCQCANEWSPGSGLPGTNGTIESLARWDPDGSGPLPEHIVAGGFLTIAGQSLAQHLVLLDPSSGEWTPLAGPDDRVYAVQPMPNGDLVIGGAFTSIDGVAANYIARWDGFSWHGFGPGADDEVEHLTVMPNGDLVAAGNFSTIGGVPANQIARWTGNTWTPLAGGPDNVITEIAVVASGDLVITGGFANVGGVACNRIARWDGAAWHPLGSGLNSAPLALTPHPAGGCVVAGNFSTAGGQPALRAARWDGTAWSPLGAGLPFVARALIATPNGEVFAGSGPEPNGVQLWNGTSWTPISSHVADRITSFLMLANGDLVMGGGFRKPDTAGPVHASGIARWDGVAWSGYSDWSVAVINDIYRQDATTVLAGKFPDPTSPTGDASIALWDGDHPTPLAPPLTEDAEAVAIDSSGRIFASVDVPVSLPSEVVQWDGVSWSTLGATFLNGFLYGSVRDLLVLPNGELLAAGEFTDVGGVAANCIAKWDGTTWVAMDSGLPNASQNDVTQLLLAPDGTLMACGSFGPVQGMVMPGAYTWNGSSWIALPLPPGPVDAIAASDHRWFAGGEFWIGGVAERRVLAWDGTAWSLLGGPTTSSPVPFFDMVVAPNGDLIVAGFFQNVLAPTTRLARWDGASWAAMGDDPTGTIFSLEFDQDGDLMCGGAFFAVGNQVSVGLAQLGTTCPATTATSGPGCDNDVLTGSRSWLGSTWRGDGGGFPSGALIADILGLQTASLPLVAVFPSSQTGCMLHVQPELVGLQLAAAGSASMQLQMPGTPALAGAVFHAQMVSLDLVGTGVVTATNALTMTVGSF